MVQQFSVVVPDEITLTVVPDRGMYCVGFLVNGWLVYGVVYVVLIKKDYCWWLQLS